MKKLIVSAAAAAVLAAGIAAPAGAEEAKNAPTKNECTAVEIAMLPLMGQAAKGPNGELRFTVSEVRGKFSQKSGEQLDGLLGNTYASILGSAKLSQDFAGTALACGLVKPDPKRDAVGSSEILNLLSSLLGTKLG